MAAVLAGTSLGIAGVAPSDRTADMPNSWLVLYNANDLMSFVWADWYAQKWDIPRDQLIGLDVPSTEKIHVDDFNARIFTPVQNVLNNDPDLKARIMGILVGYRVPGNFYKDETHPPLQSGGGWSVANNLCDMHYSAWYKRPNPHYFAAYSITQPRLTKASLGTDCYITARLDGPAIEDVIALTNRALAISAATTPLPKTERISYDDVELGAPGGDEWTGLRFSTERDNTSLPAWMYPWEPFESQNIAAPSQSAICFS